MLKLIEEEVPQREIQETAYRYQQDVESKARLVVGVNEFVMDEPPPAGLFQVDPAVGAAMAERLDRLLAAAPIRRAEHRVHPEPNVD